MAHALPSVSRIGAPQVGQGLLAFAVRGNRPSDDDFARPLDNPEVVLDLDDHLRLVAGAVIGEGLGTVCGVAARSAP